ncbi:ATPase [Paenibacillus albilobatus]|uniref:ATPase n=1 Tax=Paenibacillus albilobatus TaxID=2716884 RepID=A0A919XKN7_9BACL|nr:ATP-binding protein [Paenibacillus albilobatus]GIO33524.1 ATPase [Paenibacillus albilobatus]
MKNYSEVIKIIDGGLRNDAKKVYDYALLLAEKLKNAGEISKSDRILKILSQQPAYSREDLIHSTKTQFTSKQLPFDQESKLEIATIKGPDQIEQKELFLSLENQRQIQEFMKAYIYSDKLAERGLDVATTLLLFGPPGCGKTQTALFVAKELSLPIIIARLDTLISSYLGSTSKNIRLLFEYASKIPCVLFLDEFDAVAKLRDDQHEMGELKRVVNSLLQNIDELGDKCILIGATNHEQLLDEAIWRRFSTRLKIGLPTLELIKQVLSQFLSDLNVVFDGKQIDLITELYAGQSISDIEQITKRGIRKAIIEDKEVEISDLVESYFAYVRTGIPTHLDADTLRRKKIEYLMKKLNKPSRRTIGELLKCHHNTVSSDLEKIEMEKEM